MSAVIHCHIRTTFVVNKHLYTEGQKIIIIIVIAIVIVIVTRCRWCLWHCWIVILVLWLGSVMVKACWFTSKRLQVQIPVWASCSHTSWYGRTNREGNCKLWKRCDLSCSHTSQPTVGGQTIKFAFRFTIRPCSRHKECFYSMYTVPRNNILCDQLYLQPELCTGETDFWTRLKW